MLGGKIVYKQTPVGPIEFGVYARDSFNDLKIYIECATKYFNFDYGATTLYDEDGNQIGYGQEIIETESTKDTLNKFKLLDFNEEKPVDMQEYVENTDEKYWKSRRLDVKKTNKYKSNIANKEFCLKVSALIRYMQIAGKQNYNQQLSSGDHFSSTRTVRIVEPKTKKELGTINYKMGLITGLVCENQFVRVELQEIPNDVLEESLFKDIKEKDKWGNRLSPTSVAIVGFKLNTELLGFHYVPEVEKEAVNAFGMYETIDDVIANNPDKNTSWILERDYHIVTDYNLEEVIQMFMEHDGLIAFDTETSGLNINFKSRTNEADQLVGCVLSRKTGEGFYFPLQHKLFANLCDGDHHYFMDRYMRPILEKKKIICHNLKFDWKVAYIYDINVNCVYDTMLALGVTKRYEEESYALGLKALAKNIFGLDMFDLSDFIIGGSFGDSDIAFWDLPYELVRQYAPADTDITLSLYEFIEKEDILNKYNAKAVFEMEITFAKAVAYSEFFGYHIDVDKIPDLNAGIIGAMEECTAEMFRLAGREFNPNSPQQLGVIMYDEMGIEMIGEKRSTDKETLKALSQKENPDGSTKYPFVKVLKTYRDNESIYKNFLKRLPEFATSDGYIFPDTLQLGTNTGRVSVKNPNYQGYNDIVKQYVTPRPGFMHVDSDFAQIEYRVLCSMAKQDQLIEAFNDPDLDYHTYQASRMFSIPYASVSKDLRQQSKGINFGLPYGMGDSSLGTRIFGERNATNTAKAAALRKKFFQGQEKIEQFFEDTRANGVKNGFTETQFGRRRYYHRGVFSVNEIRRQAGNHVIQGCLHGDTLIQTKELGIVKIKDIVGLNLHVWDGEQWTKGDITYSGKKKKCVVNFRGGNSVICSPIHKFQVVSHRGNKRFVDCKDLRSLENGKSAHRVVINQKYQQSDYIYSSKDAYKYMGKVHNANNVFLEDIENSFDIGLVLGRLASDGSISLRENGGSSITQYIAEHEFNILPKLKSCMKVLGLKEQDNEVRENRNEKVNCLNVYSTSLVKEITDLDIKNRVHENIFMDTELLRGFLSGVFDGDGGISGKTITLTFGTQYDFEPMCKDLQKALLFFGIRSNYRKYDGDRHVLAIKTNDNQKFLDIIGFINEEKQKKGRTLTCVEDECTFGPALIVESVEMTEDFIDMYDVCNTERGYYVANGVITHNTAADIYKLAVIHLFDRVCAEGWLGKVLFCGFIHDELLMEVHESINPWYFTKAWREEFEVKIEGYCRLFAGLGFGFSWYEAKKLDLPPHYITEIEDAYDENKEWDENLVGFIEYVKENYEKHKTNRISTFIRDEENQDDIIKPVIGSLLTEEIAKIGKEIQKIGVDEYNALLEKGKIPVEGKVVLKDLQDQLKVFCKYYDLDYSAINIKSPDDILVKVEIDTRDEMEDDVIENYIPPFTKEELIQSTLRMTGYCVDYETLTLHISEMWYKTSSGLVQGTKILMDKHLFTPEGMYKIMYYPTVQGDNLQSAEIPNFKVSGENLTIVLNYYKAWLDARIGVIA